MAYGQSIVTTVEPTAEPITLADAKLHCRIPSADTSQDDWLTAAIVAAREVVEARTGLAMMTQQFRLRLSGFAAIITLPKPPLQTVQAVKYLDADGVEQILGASIYHVHTDPVPGLVVLGPSQVWPTLQSGAALPVSIEYTAGYATAADIPQKAKQAMLLLISHWYEHRTAVTPSKMSELPLAFESLIRQLDIGVSWVM